jgi:hypothetical protein
MAGKYMVGWLAAGEPLENISTVLTADALQQCA